MRSDTVYVPSTIPQFCQFCLARHICDYDFKWEIRNNGFNNECPDFMLAYSKLKPHQVAEVEHLLKRVKIENIGQTQLSWVKDHLLPKNP